MMAEMTVMMEMMTAETTVETKAKKIIKREKSF
jgi:hypothetical protein